MDENLGPYRIIRTIGVGGMGEVFLAEDPRLGRFVALKRPSEEWLRSHDSGERLRREARAAGQLNHANIAAVYDVFDIEGRPHIVMEYVEGETLAALLRRGAVPPDRVLDIGLQLVDALCEAHAHGVIHRDLKPANVILTPSGRIKILDFGVAKMTSSESATTEAATDVGRIVGTPGYMAPEQLAGLPIDPRVDIYGAGLLLYELLVGRGPYATPEELDRALAAPALPEGPRPNAVNPEVPADLSTVVARALARQPGKRFQRAQDLRDALNAIRVTATAAPVTGEPAVAPTRSRRWLVAGLAAVALVIAAIIARPMIWSKAPPPAPAGTQVIAVLPFANLTGDPANDSLAMGFADSLVIDLATVSMITVVRRDDLRELKGARDARTVARQLGATLIVDPSLQRAGNDLRVNVQLLAADASHVWSDKYEGTTDRVFDLQRRIADGVILGGALGSAAAHSGTPLRSSDLAALISYGQGRAKLDRSDVAGNIEESMDLFQAAITRDPAFALAHAALGEAAVRRYGTTKDAKWVDVALKETDEAVRLDPTLADVYVSRASAYRQTGRRAEAIDALERAIALQRSHDNAHEVLGDTLLEANRPDEALAQFHEAIRLRPSARHYDRLGTALFRLGRYDEAITALAKFAELQPDNASAHHKLGTAYQVKEDYSSALREFGEAIKIRPLSSTYSNMGTIQYDQKDYAGAVRSFEGSVKMTPNEPQLHRNLGDGYQKIGQPAKAREHYLMSLKLLDDSLKVNPTSAAFMGQRAVLLAKVGRVADALKQAADANVVSSTSGDVLYRRAVVFSLAGQPADALKALDLALARGYSPRSAEHDDDMAAVRASPAFRELLQKHKK
jgi:tetratricopeptide (TPR) repeat protein/TolB-like protein/predicted Ser/Thr protein kinase